MRSAAQPTIDLTPPPEVPNLADPVTRAQLTPAAVVAIARLAEIWRLTGAEICALLGDVSDRTWFRMR
jgi:hypothetical protein